MMSGWARPPNPETHEHGHLQQEIRPEQWRNANQNDASPEGNQYDPKAADIFCGALSKERK